MKPNDEDYSYFKECLEKLIKLGLFNEKIAGITKFVMAQGYEKLSQKQKYVFDENVIDRYFNRICSRCEEEIPWCEMPYIVEDEEKICGACQHILEKND